MRRESQQLFREIAKSGALSVKYNRFRYLDAPNIGGAPAAQSGAAAHFSSRKHKYKRKTR
jgi:hypothetical protein